jgi:hypothetical protein
MRDPAPSMAIRFVWPKPLPVMTIVLLFLSMVTSAIIGLPTMSVAVPQPGDFGLIESDRDHAGLGARRRRAGGENECGSKPKARRHQSPLWSGD